MPRKAFMNRKDFLNEVRNEQDQRNVPVVEKQAMLFAYMAACFVMGGPEDDLKGTDNIHTTQADSIVNLLVQQGIVDYFKESFGKLSDLSSLQYEHFLNRVLGQLDLNSVGIRNAVILQRKAELEEQLEDIPESYADYWHEHTTPVENNVPYVQKSESVYEYEAPMSSWRLFAAAGHVLAQTAGKPLSENEVSRLKEAPINRLLLRNKQTVEKLERGELNKVQEDVFSLRRSFKFMGSFELSHAQNFSRDLEADMEAMTGPAAESDSWRELKEAVHAFNEEKDLVKAISASARVLTAVEKFTKGKKSEQEAQTQRCVDLALKALSCCIPDAKNNPSVKPLIKRFNTVRGWHLFQKKVELEDLGLSPAPMADNDLFPKTKKVVKAVQPAPDQNIIQPQQAGGAQGDEINLQPKAPVMPLNIQRPENLERKNVQNESFSEEDMDIVPLSQVDGPAKQLFASIRDKKPVTKEMAVDAFATMIASQESRYVDIYSEEIDYEERVDRNQFEKRKEELKNDPMVNNLTNHLVFEDPQVQRKLYNAALNSHESDDPQFNMNVLVNMLYMNAVENHKAKEQQNQNNINNNNINNDNQIEDEKKEKEVGIHP